MLTVWVLPPAAGASAVAAPDRIIRHSFTFNPTPSFTLVFPTGPTAQPSTPGRQTEPVTHPGASTLKSAVNGGYVSTFSPAAVVQSPDPTSSAACLANGQPVSGPGGDLDLPGIAGTSTDPGHTGALKITGLGPASMIPPEIDSADLTELQITRTVDKASANLAMVASSGYRLACAHIEIGGGQGYSSAQFALLNAGLVADDQTGNVETLTVTYSSILWSYTEPGSPTVHTGSGKINARPDKMHANLATDSRFIAEGTIGLSAVVALGLIALYVVGRKRHRRRYRSRYYRRMSARARQAEYVQYQEQMQYQQQLAQQAPTLAEPEPELASVLEEPEVLETPAAAEVVEEEPETEAAAEVKPKPEPAPEPELEPEPEAEPEAEPEPGAELALESEADSETEPVAESESESESESEGEPETETAAETDSEPEAKAAPEAEPEAESPAEAAAEPEPDSEAEPEPEPESEPEPRREAAAEPEADDSDNNDNDTDAEPVTEEAAVSKSSAVASSRSS